MFIGQTKDKYLRLFSDTNFCTHSNFLELLKSNVRVDAFYIGLASILTNTNITFHILLKIFRVQKIVSENPTYIFFSGQTKICNFGIVH